MSDELVLDSLQRRMRALHSLYEDAVATMDLEAPRLYTITKNALATKPLESILEAGDHSVSRVNMLVVSGFYGISPSGVAV